ncbi:MAG: hypothetical protein OEZ36_13320 [Spirochaetota bacterium]|nr:hypothetical protein [Spirochaetota bacterium]
MARIKGSFFSIVLTIFTVLFSVITVFSAYLAWHRIILPYNESGRYYHNHVVWDTDTRDVLILLTVISFLITLLLLLARFRRKPGVVSSRKG